jgi:hypothetical protein
MKSTWPPCLNLEFCDFNASHAPQSRQEYARCRAAAPLICRPADIIWQGEREAWASGALTPYCPLD